MHKVKQDCKQLQQMLEKRSVELATCYQQLYQEIAKRQQAESELEKYRDHLELLVNDQTAELEEALEKARKLSGFLTICASCKKILDEEGIWNKIEKYIEDHSEARFTHSICQECSKKLYPEIAKEKDNQSDT